MTIVNLAISPLQTVPNQPLKNWKTAKSQQHTNLSRGLKYAS